MTTTTQPYEILLRFKADDGTYSGAHFLTIETVKDDTGKVIARNPSNAQPLDLASDAGKALIGQAVVVADAALVAMTADRDAQKAALTALQAQTQAAIADVKAALAVAPHPEIQAIVAAVTAPADVQKNAALQAQIDALKAQMVTVE